MRLIDGDRLIEWIKHLDERGRIVTLSDIRFIVSELAKDINVPRNNWFKVGDAKPEMPDDMEDDPNQAVLVCDGNGTIRLTRSVIAMETNVGEKVYFDDSYIDDWLKMATGQKVDINPFTYKNRITHWMPVPKIPKEETT